MYVSWNWLATLVDLTGASPHVIAEQLTNAGLEVESVDRKGPVFSDITLAFVEAVNPHPNADKLRLGTLKTGNGTMTVVCGAPNLAAGQWVAYAREGSQVLNRKTGETFTLTPAVIRGVPSEGMICSVDELGLAEQFPPTEDGIWVLNDRVGDQPVGTPLETLLGLNADWILHTAPTANRGDCMSMVGIAREVAALTGRALTLPTPNALPTSPLPAPWQINLTQPSVCHQYTGVLLENIQVKPSSDWLRTALEAANTRSINVVVDITNYVMLQWGQPLHAFDADRLTPGTVDVVGGAHVGQAFTTLDDIERTLQPESVMVTVSNTPVAIAGVMGGTNSRVEETADYTTSRLFLEGALFPAAPTRRSAKSVGLRTDASARFERGVDPETLSLALAHAVQLYQELAGATVVGVGSAVAKAPDAPLTLPLTADNIERVMGIPISSERVPAILEPLGFECQSTSPETWQVTVPSWRANDVTRTIDVVEELARVVGYDDIPDALPPLFAPGLPSPRRQMLARLRQALSGAGLQEVMTNSLIGPQLLAQTGFTLDDTALLAVENSHSPEHTLMRQSVLPTLLECAKGNMARGETRVGLFELGRTYWCRSKPTPKHTGVVETLMLSALLTGDLPLVGAWSVPSISEASFLALKGMLGQTLARLGFAEHQWRVQPLDEALTAANKKTLALLQPYTGVLHPGIAGSIQVLDPAEKTPTWKTLGIIGQYHPRLQKQLKLRKPVFVLELDADALMKLASAQWDKHPIHTLSAFQPVVRDVAFVTPVTVSHAVLSDALRAAANATPATATLVQDIALFDVFTGEALGADKRSLAYRVTLQSGTGTLTDAEIEAALAQLRSQMLATVPEVSLR